MLETTNVANVFPFEVAAFNRCLRPCLPDALASSEAAGIDCSEGRGLKTKALLPLRQRKTFFQPKQSLFPCIDSTVLFACTWDGI